MIASPKEVNNALPKEDERETFVGPYAGMCMILALRKANLVFTKAMEKMGSE